MKIDEKVFSKLTEEQKKKVKSAKTPEELLAIAEEAGYELTEKELSAICGGQGGDRFCNDDCYFCGTDGWMV